MHEITVRKTSGIYSYRYIVELFCKKLGWGKQMGGFGEQDDAINFAKVKAKELDLPYGGWRE